MSDKWKIGLLSALVAALALWWWLSGRAPQERKQRSFREKVADVDTAALRSFTLVAPAAEGGVPILFQRDSLGWVAVQEGHSTRAFQLPLNDLFTALSNLRPQAVPGSDPAVVRRYALTDSLCAWFQSPQVMDGRPLRIGSTTTGPANPTLEAPPVATAMMVAGDPNVYLVPGAFSEIPAMSFVDWIPKPMVNGDHDRWDHITFTFPDGRSYSLDRVAAGWAVSGEPADSLKVEKFLYALSRYYGNALADPADTLHARPLYQIKVEGRMADSPIFLGVFAAGDHLIARSTLAPRWLVTTFDPRTELPRMFRPPEAFLPDH